MRFGFLCATLFPKARQFQQISAPAGPGMICPTECAELQPFQGKDQQGKSEKTLRTYNYRLGFFLDFTAQQNLRYLDQIDRKQLLRYVKFLRDHESDLDDRTVHNVFETLNTFLRTRDIFIAGKILAELDYAEKPPKPYMKPELKEMFAAMDEEERNSYH